MKNAIDDFEASPYNYCIYTNQPVLPDGARFADEFYYFIPFDSEGVPSYEEATLNAYQFNLNTIETFKLKLEEGRFFNADEMILSKNVPVVVGNAYKDFLNNGDTISVVYLNQSLDLTVVGILEKDSLIINQGYASQLDWSIVMPSFSDYDRGYASSDELFDFYLMLYMQKIGGNFVMKNDDILPELMAYIGDVARKYGIFELAIIGMPRNGISLLGQVSRQYFETKVLWCIISLLLCLICCIRYILYVFQENARRYAIYIICGASSVQLIWIVASLMITLSTIANAIAFSVTFLLIGIHYDILMFLSSAVLSTALAIMILCIKLENQSDIVATICAE